MRPIRTDVKDEFPYGPERGACAIYMSARKQGQSTFGTLKRALGALVQMGHRTGFVNGEGDGAGVQTDIPRRLWTKKLSQIGLPSYLATQPGFWVGHLFIPPAQSFERQREAISSCFAQQGLGMLINQPGRVRPEALGQNARIDPPTFWQIAGYSDAQDVEERLLSVQIELESRHPFHFSSLSSHTVVYKIRGSVECLSRYYPDLQDRNYDTSMVLSHARYSTNTVSSFERAQPFGIIGHNGEINTINRFRREANQIGVVLPENGSDSQDVDRALHTLCVRYGLNLIEALETVFPPTPYELSQFPADLRAVYSRIRQSFGPYAQGPAGIVARYGNDIVASVDALGLRPLWFVETEKEYIFSSERGAIPLEIMVSDPHPFAPGEKMAINFHRGEKASVLSHAMIRQQVMTQMYQREAPQLASLYWTGWENGRAKLDPIARRRLDNQVGQIPIKLQRTDSPAEIGPDQQFAVEVPWKKADQRQTFGLASLAANGWQLEHLRDLAAYTAADNQDLVCSLGYDGPLAALAQNRVNLADYYKELVAVVTNPAIDQARESEVFSTSSLLGASPEIGQAPDSSDLLVVVEIPILLGGLPGQILQEVNESIAAEFGTLTIEQAIAKFGGKTHFLALGLLEGETTQAAVERLSQQAVEKVQSGVMCLVLDDSMVTTGIGRWLDPHLATAAVDEALRKAGADQNLRRRVGVIVRSASIRTLHDIALLCGFGADAINPYIFTGLSLKFDQGGISPEESEIVLRRLVQNIKTGLEKVISTMGCHELRGYGRVCSSIGLSPGLAAVMKSPNYFGSENCGLSWARLDQDSADRRELFTAAAEGLRLPRQERFYPKFWKKVAAYAASETGYADLRKTYQTLSEQMPVALRHLIAIKHVTDVIDPTDVDLTVHEYNLPLVIDAMSFGSQGELSYKAYAQAASQLNIICINGEGGELPEMMGLYRKNRGQQIASGRFGVNAEFLNSAAVLEIKIGQGAKPGEGGMLPGFKITPQVASARKTPPNVTLLSPSNNHDLYSIEDLAQLIEELRMVNPQARISVKVPVVPGIGVIAVGIAKAGADIINLSGYDGGTGAARKHSIQYVGLPAEIGVIQSHRALIDAGIRHKVEIWCNGGMKTGEDVVKMILLGANRVGFATMAMVAIGCSICRRCDRGNCSFGIATQVKTREEAAEKGIKGFVPLELSKSVDRLVRLFKGIGEEVRGLTAQLGETHLQSLVGRADLLEQLLGKDRVDLQTMFEPAPIKARPALEPGVGILLIRPRNSLTSISSELIVNTILGDEKEVTYQDTVMAYDRALGARLAGELVRNPQLTRQIDCLHLRFGPSSLAGNGFAAWISDQIDILIEGGAQDGVAKGAAGGRVAVMKGINHEGMRIDGSVGKSFAYGAQNGVFIVQGNADSRACVRLSGADVVLGGEISSLIDDSKGDIGANANLKGFACEYMTCGNVVILGDPGPYAFSGMTGGQVFQMLNPVLGFDQQALQRRLAQGANVAILPIDLDDLATVRGLLGHYIEALEQTYQYDAAEHIRSLCDEDTLFNRFLKVIPIPVESELAVQRSSITSQLDVTLAGNDLT